MDQNLNLLGKRRPKSDVPSASESLMKLDQVLSPHYGLISSKTF